MRPALALLLVPLLLLGCAQEEADDGMDERLQHLEEKVDHLEECMEEVEERIDVIEEEVDVLGNETPAQEPAADTVAPVEKGKTRFKVTVMNVHKTQTLSPGLFIVHKPIFSINFVGKLAPPELEPLAEYGDPSAFAGYVNQSNDVLNIHVIDKPLAPGENTSFILDVSTWRPRESYLSGLLMAVGSNDGYALADNIALFNPGNGPKASTTDALNYDAGMEQNSPLMSGFDGGQPDPSRGAENIGNGVATSPQLPVTFHTQLSGTLMRVIVTPQ
jgi:hypothetical protein